MDNYNMKQLLVMPLTYSPPFNSFPMFSHDGKKLVLASNRGGKVKGGKNIFIADWKD